MEKLIKGKEETSRDMLVPCDSCGSRVGEWCKHVKDLTVDEEQSPLATVRFPKDIQESVDPSLLPCPFEHYPEQVRLCGNLPPELKHEHHSWWIQCPVCGTSTVSFLRPKSASLFWNRRASTKNTKSSQASHNNNLIPHSPASQSNSAVSNIQSTLAEIRELRKAIACLYLAVPKEIADDVKAKAEAVLSIIDSLQPCPAILLHPLAQSLIGRILTADAPMCDPHDVDLRLHSIITERDSLRTAASNMKAAIVERVREKAAEYERKVRTTATAGLFGSMADLLHSLATELEVVELDQDQKVVK